MHTFPDYAPCGDAQVAGLVQDNPFAAVISTGHGVPVATHVPVIIPPPGQLRAGGVLWGHMARANPQWQAFDPARPVLVIFTGAHACGGSDSAASGHSGSVGWQPLDMAADPQDAPRHAGHVVLRVLLRRNIAVDAETAQLVAAVQAALQVGAPSRRPRRRPRVPTADCEPPL
jgi:putative FMN-binding protein